MTYHEALVQCRTTLSDYIHSNRPCHEAMNDLLKVLDDEDLVWLIEKESEQNAEKEIERKPEKPENDFIITGKEYHVWKENQYLGKAVWTDDDNVGEKFIRKAIEQGITHNWVLYEPDHWELA